MKPADAYRIQVLEKDWNTPSFRDPWPLYREEIIRYLGTPITSDGVRRVGENLRQIILDVGKSSAASRDNAGVSRVGNIFECMIGWYLNLLFWGTPVVVSKGGSFPKVLKDAVTVKIENKTTSKDPDLLAFAIPDHRHFTVDTPIDDWLLENIRDVDVTIIQTKTTWNENAQIPMLWNWLYGLGSSPGMNIHIGNNGVGPEALKELRYAFVVMPTQKNLKTFKENGMPAKRVKALTGGNYWCTKKKEGVAQALHEFAIFNYPNEIYATEAGHLWGHVQQNLDNDPDAISSFLDLNFNG